MTKHATNVRIFPGYDGFWYADLDETDPDAEVIGPYDDPNEAWSAAKDFVVFETVYVEDDRR